MNHFWRKIIINTILKNQGQTEGNVNDYSKYRLAKGFLELKITLIRYMKDALLLTAGIFAASFGFKGFLLTNYFIDGGATGIALLISGITGIPLYLLIVCVNIPFFILAYKVMGRNFAIKTALAIGGLALCVATVNFPNVTNDNLLVAIFGGFFLGAGIGLAVRGGAVIDGTEVLAIFLSKKFGTTIGDIIILINILIFSAAAYFLGVEIAMYSMITYLSASKTLDFIVEGIEEYIGVSIISSHSDEIREMIINKLGRGVTIYTGKRGFGTRGETRDTDIIYTVITRLELNRLNTEIQKIDHHCFVVMNSVKDTKGGMIKKRPLKH
ncbi:MAG: YitT family protein [Chitinophagaceae bacterium]|nr:YitT family protein [Chitinophagaceae bacterium]